MVAFRWDCPMIGSSGRAAGIAGQSHRSQSSSASIARRMGAGSIGQAATIRARSAAKATASDTAPDFAAPWAKKPIFPVFLRGVPVLSSPLWFSTYRAKLFCVNNLAFLLRRQKASLVHMWCTKCAREDGGEVLSSADRAVSGSARSPISSTTVAGGSTIWMGSGRSAAVPGRTSRWPSNCPPRSTPS